ncbi:unnamed protein product, partial [Rotaria sordida]
RYTKTIEGQFVYDEGNEFELIEEIDEEYLHVIHLRSTDRGVIQRCLFQYNIPGAYLVRRSNTESNAFVLSVAHILNRRNAEDWHYLICVNPLNHCFYFAQESKLNHILFKS